MENCNRKAHADIDTGSIAFLCAVALTTVCSVIYVCYSFKKSGINLDVPLPHWWTAVPILAVTMFAPAAASWALALFLLKLVGQRAFERTFYALASMGIFSLGLFETRAGVRAVEFIAGPSFIALQTLFPDWTLTSVIDEATKALCSRFPRLAWLDRNSSQRVSFKTQLMRNLVISILAGAVICFVLVPLILGFCLASALAIALGLALLVVSFFVGQLANDPPVPQICFIPSDPFLDDFNKNFFH